MARLSSASSPAQPIGLPKPQHTPHVPRLNASALDVASAELGQLLDRLQRTLLHADAERERRLRTSEFERARVESNLGFARSSLTKLEQDALGIKAPGRRSEVQGDLNKKREVLELLMDRLQDLRQMSAEMDDDDETSDEEDLLGEIIPTPSESMGSTSASTDLRASRIGEEPIEPPQTEPVHTYTIPEPSSTPQPDEPPRLQTSELSTQTSQTLRNRTSAPSPTPSSHTSARAALFANRRKPATATASASTATAEAILDQQRAEQDVLSDSILKMAQALKASSHKFSSTLEADMEVVSKAGEGIEKTQGGMEAATGRMTTLKRMTEGKSWWGRVILYAWVYGMMVGLILLVFVMPKLRF